MEKIRRDASVAEYRGVEGCTGADCSPVWWFRLRCDWEEWGIETARRGALLPCLICLGMGVACKLISFDILL